MRKVLVIFFGGVFALILLSSALPGMSKNQRNSGETALLNLFVQEQKYSSEEADIFDKTGIVLAGVKNNSLPIGAIEEFKADNAWGAAVLLPQIHRYPGSASGDSANDSAETAQKQIYSILEHLNQNNGIDFVMAEGDLYGEVAPDKILSISEKIKLRNKFAGEIVLLKEAARKANVSQAAQDAFFSRADRSIALLDREIILEGAPYKLKAEGNDLILYGSENKATLDESAGIVRNYIYQQDRYGQLAGINLAQKQISPLSSSSLLNSRESSSSLLKIINSLKAPRDSEKSLSRSDFDLMRLLADTRNQTDFSNLLAETEDTYGEILKRKNSESSASDSPLPAPSRADNPYRSITDPKRLKAMLEKSEKQIQNVVIDKRNKETAANFAQALKDLRASSGAIEYGAGHEQGLIEELNKQGISVIVITAEEIAENKSEQMPVYSGS